VAVGEVGARRGQRPCTAHVLVMLAVGLSAGVLAGCGGAGAGDESLSAHDASVRRGKAASFAFTTPKLASVAATRKAGIGRGR
jgi:hypothetical protein